MFEGKKAGPARVVRRARPIRMRLAGWTSGGKIAGATASAASLFLAFVLLTHLEWGRQPPPDWRPLYDRAEAAAARGDRYEARHFYVNAARAASWTEDWRGLLSAACGMRKLEGVRQPSDAVHGLLLRAMIAAESRRSRAGLEAVAQALAAVGEAAAAAMVVKRRGDDWPDDKSAAQEAEDASFANCGAR